MCVGRQVKVRTAFFMGRNKIDLALPAQFGTQWPGCVADKPTQQWGLDWDRPWRVADLRLQRSEKSGAFGSPYVSWSQVA